MSLADDILATFEYMQNVGWTKGSLHDHKTPHGGGLGACSIGAAELVTETGLEDGKERYAAVIKALNDEVRILGYGTRGIVSFNDDPQTTFAMLQLVFSSAALRARSARALGQKQQAIHA